MNNHPVLEMDFEKSLKEDRDGSFLHELQRSLTAYCFAIEQHISTGLSSEEFARWKNLKTAVETATGVSEKLREDFQDA